jgi:hypothetical protein
LQQINILFILLFKYVQIFCTETRKFRTINVERSDTAKSGATSTAPISRHSGSLLSVAVRTLSSDVPNIIQIGRKLWKCGQNILHALTEARLVRTAIRHSRTKSRGRNISYSELHSNRSQNAGMTVGTHRPPKLTYGCHCAKFHKTRSSITFLQNSSADLMSIRSRV